ncbi:hypothetical protein BIW11_07999 [Tropilaelaps mercedesae]|uniref:Secreted protein n=1 Tax=Tropilaelaps mercedesae TaxID=418985 RepID=A0A1V9XRS2_9ACAR|nr:hypothetical protein BIW11_07999 [Tropilaelaps mercedesae]
MSLWMPSLRRCRLVWLASVVPLEADMQPEAPMHSLSNEAGSFKRSSPSKRHCDVSWLFGYSALLLDTTSLQKTGSVRVAELTGSKPRADARQGWDQRTSGQTIDDLND